MTSACAVQEVCYHVVRILATTVCPTLDNTGPSVDIILRTKKAAKHLLDSKRYRELRAPEVELLKRCIDDLKNLYVEKTGRSRITLGEREDPAIS